MAAVAPGKARRLQSFARVGYSTDKMQGALQRKPWAALTAAALLCGLTVATTSVVASTAPAAVVKVAFNKKLKRKILVDARGRTLYLFQADLPGTSACTDPQCVKLWPPLTTVGAPVAGKGIKAGLLGTFDRGGGITQVTYNKHQLYFYRGGYGYKPGDRKPGQIRGQGFLSVWWVVSPKGNAIHK